ncbi:MAG: restriction endonuclease subunit S [Thermoplasmata archaeon]
MTWEVKTLDQISENLDSKRVPITKNIRRNGSIPYYGASGIVDYVEEYIFDEDLLLVSEDGANLLARTYPIAFSISGKTWVNNHAHVLRFKDKISQKFVELYLNSIKLADFVSGMAQPKLNQAMLNKIPIPFPPLSEQKRIVAILNKSFESITRAKENAEKNLNNAKEIFESYLQSVFENKGEGWEEKKLGEVCEIKPQKSEARTKLKETDHVSFVPMEDLGINQKMLIPTKERTLKEVEGSYTYFANGDVLLAKITPCFENGKLGIAEKLKNSIGFGSSEYIVFRANKDLFSEFLYYFLLRSQFRVEGAKRMMGAVGHKRVSKEFIEQSEIYLPSLKEQQSIVKKLDKLSIETKNLGAIYEKKLADLEELKKSILQKAFNGKLTEVSA